MSNKIWSKNRNISQIAEDFNTFTTGDDYILDKLFFLKYDIQGTKAHVQTLWLANVITDAERDSIYSVLNRLLNSDEVVINPSDEDCHTALERILINELGDTGKKVHTGRSRNDQSLTMIRLWMRQSLIDIASDLFKLKSILDNLADVNRNQVFIGYSHTQQAMLTTLGHYYNSFAEQILDDAKFAVLIKDHINKNPLGSGAGFGSPLKLDRDASTKIMGFNQTQQNSLYCQNSRGKFELQFLHTLSQIMLTLQKMSTDMIMYTTREFSFFDIDDNLAQGSSMMPQKKNLDVFEIIRAKSSEVISLENRVQLILKGLPSGYNRDLQIIKNAIIESHHITEQCIKHIGLALPLLKPNDNNIRKSIKPDIYSTDVAIIKCMENNKLNFRDVYNKVLEDEFNFKPEDIIKSRKSQGSPGNY